MSQVPIWRWQVSSGWVGSDPPKALQQSPLATASQLGKALR